MYPTIFWLNFDEKITGPNSSWSSHELAGVLTHQAHALQALDHLKK